MSDDKISGIIIKLEDKSFTIKNSDEEELVIKRTGEIPKELYLGDYFFKVKVGEDKFKCGVFLPSNQGTIKHALSHALCVRDKSGNVISFPREHKVEVFFEDFIKNLPTYPGDIAFEQMKRSNIFPSDICEDFEDQMSYLCYNNYLVYGDNFKYSGKHRYEMKQVMGWWKYKRDYRRLFSIGLTKEEIVGAKLPPYKIYKICEENPFKIPTITIEKAEEISFYFSYEPNEDDYLYGDILRFVFNKCEKYFWTSVPRNLIKIDDLDNHKLKYYGMRLRKIDRSNNFEGIQHSQLDEYIYLEHNWKVEKEMINYLETKIIRNLKCKYEKMIGASSFEIAGKKFELNESQIKGIEGLLTYDISIVTGGAGTGKTTTLKNFKKEVGKRGKRVILCSFTGKAVSIMKRKTYEAIGRSNCFTIDRLISSSGLLQFDYLLIDEFSMVTIEKLYELVRCFDHDYKIGFIGDNNQIPPIGWGWLSNELLKSNRVPTFNLTYNHRAQESDLISQCDEFIKTDPLDYEKFEFKESDYFHMLPIKSKSGLLEIFRVLKKLNKCGINANDISCITATNEDRLRVTKLFREIFMMSRIPEREQYHIDEEFLEKFSEDHQLLRNDIYLEDDRVMHIANNYEEDVMNGEEGIVVKATEENVLVNINESLKTYWYSSQNKKSDEKRSLLVKEIEFSQCKTIFKSQGDEYDYVIAYLPKRASYLSRNDLYTMLTRVKKELWLVYDTSALEKVNKRKIIDKYDNLGDILFLRKSEEESILNELTVF